MTKTKRMLELEAQHNTSIRELILETYARTGSHYRTAEALGVPLSTYAVWRFRLGIENTLIGRVEELAP